MLVAIFPSSSSPFSSRLMLARFLDGLATREATACLLRGITWLSFLVTRQCLFGRSKAGSKHSTDHCLDGLNVTRTGHGSSNKLQLHGAAVIQETNRFQVAQIGGSLSSALLLPALDAFLSFVR